MEKKGYILLLSFCINIVIKAEKNFEIIEKMKHFSKERKPHGSRRKLGATTGTPETCW